ncbi:MAG: HYExAFE family protein [Pirellulales bacterium]|nr:HYExAFE family protein [Pirellulales bacterium]
MANRDNHYEAAFEEYLRRRQVPYIAVDEAKRAKLSGDSLESLDFVVSTAERRWLVDVKGRLFPSGAEQKQYWKNWSPREDLLALASWERLFGKGFAALFVFAYHVVGDRAPVTPERLFTFRDRVYAFIGIPLEKYAPRARRISPKWDTVAMSVSGFRKHARPVDEFFASPQPIDASVEDVTDHDHVATDIG